MEPVVYLNHDKQQLMVNDRPILKGMTENFTLSSVTEGHGHFLEVNNSAHVVSLGVLSCLSFTASFRRDRWYMARETGDWGDLKWDVPSQTEFLLVKSDNQQGLYTIFFPLQGVWIQSNVENKDKLELHLHPEAKGFTRVIFLSAGSDPFKLVHDAFCFMEESLHDERVHYLQPLATGNMPPSEFVIIDDYVSQHLSRRSPSPKDVSLLKIWRGNKYGGVMGMFHCQGVAWSSASSKLGGSLTELDVRFTEFVHGDRGKWNHQFAFYAHCEERVFVGNNVRLWLNRPFQHEVLVVAPIMKFGDRVVAVFGFIDLLYPCSSIEGIDFEEVDHELPKVKEYLVNVKLKGNGKFAVYSSFKPAFCLILGKMVEFNYNYEDHLVTINVDPRSDGNPSQDVSLVWLTY